jgi:hypothetical protein
VVYSPGDDFGPGNVTSDIASYGNAVFYTPNADQPTTSGIYDVQYYNYPLVFYPAAPSGYPYYYGPGTAGSPYWPVPEHLHNNIPGGTEYMVIVETINGVNGWTCANYTGSTNMTATGQPDDYMPNIYLEQIPTPKLKFRNYTTGEIVINWTGLNENISDNCLDGLQSWKGNANNVLNYSVYRSTNGGDFVRAGTSTPQVRGGEVWFVETVEPGDYYYRIAVNYGYGVNDGINIIDETGVNPENTKGLPGIFVSTSKSNVSDVLTMLDVKKPIITDIHPENGELIPTNSTVISANYSDESGINVSSVVLKVDGVPVTPTTITKNGISYTATDLLDKEYDVYLYIEDDSSSHNSNSTSWSFNVDATSPYVVSTTPVNNSESVKINEQLSVVFNKRMDKTSVENAFSISPEVGNWTWNWPDNYTMIGTHEIPFEADTLYSTLYTWGINITAKDEVGHHLTHNYTWYFTTPPHVSIVLNSPNGGEDWTGGSTHDINYTLSEGKGTPPYTIYFNYTAGGVEYSIGYESRDASGIYTYPWVLPEINSTMVEVRATVIDANSLSDMEMSSTYFEIDSKAPNVFSTTPMNGAIDVGLTDLVQVTFNEPMDHASAESSFSITPDLGGWNWTWNNDGTVMTGDHNPFSANITYNCTISTAAKDDSLHDGNNMLANYSWSFTVVSGISVTITSPLGGEKWTGNTAHNIIYRVVGGAPNYTVYINYTVDGEIFNITKETNVAEGLHICPWTPQITGLKSVTVKVDAVDSLGATDSYTTGVFTIDSTKPGIIIDSIIPGNNTIALLTQPIIIQFSEPMNTASAEAAFSITNDPSGWVWTWNDAKDTMTGTHAPFTSGTTYTCTINATATDISVPGNLLNASYQWSFTAVAGKGDLRVIIDYPSSPEVGKNYKITVKIYNDGPKAINVSGSLTVTFYVNNKVIDTKNVPPIQKDAYAEVSSESFSFDSKGSWSMKVKVSSTNTADLVGGSAQPYEEMRSVNVAQPIGIGPYILITYILIIVMVALVMIVGALTLFGIKKKKKTV